MSKQSLDIKLDEVLKKLAEQEERLGRIEHAASGIEAATGSPELEEGRKRKWPRLHRLWSRVQSLPLLAKIALRFLAGMVSTGLVVLGALSAWVSLRYDVSVTNLGTLDAPMPLESRFLVTNNGPFSIYNVTYYCRYAHFTMGGREMSLQDQFLERPIDELRERGSYSVRCAGSGWNLRILPGAILEIHVLYTPRFLPWVRRDGGQQFLLKTDKAENAVWLPLAWFTDNWKDLEKEHANP